MPVLPGGGNRREPARPVACIFRACAESLRPQPAACAGVSTEAGQIGLVIFDIMANAGDV